MVWNCNPFKQKRITNTHKKKINDQNNRKKEEEEKLSKRKLTLAHTKNCTLHTRSFSWNIVYDFTAIFIHFGYFSRNFKNGLSLAVCLCVCVYVYINILKWGTFDWAIKINVQNFQCLSKKSKFKWASQLAIGFGLSFCQTVS